MPIALASYLTITDGRPPTVGATSKLGRLLDLLGEADPRQAAVRTTRLPLMGFRYRAGERGFVSE